MIALDWDRLLEDCVDFARRLVRTPSMTYQEQALAAQIAGELGRLDYDEVWSDDCGNVYGRVAGRERGLGAVVLNTHLDHVDPGDPSLWPSPPYEAALIDGHIVGRGACDIKGPLAVQVYALAAFKRAGRRPRRDVVFTGVVQEEIGGAGTRYWVERLDYPVALVLLGEPSGNKLCLGHRGIYGVWAVFRGRSAHASVPEKADNPNYALASFLSGLRLAVDRIPPHPRLGRTTVAPTIIEVDTTSHNVTPAWTRVFLDFRSATESPRALHALIADVAGVLDVSILPGWDGLALPDSDEPLTGFYTPEESDLVAQVRAALAEGLGQEPALSHYRFATDGRLIAPAGIPVLGFGPGDEAMAHTAGERIAVAEMGASLRAQVALLDRF